MKFFSFFKKKVIRTLSPEEVAILKRENEESRLHAMPDNLQSSLSGESTLATPKLRQGIFQNGIQAIVGRRVLEPRKHLPRINKEEL